MPLILPANTLADTGYNIDNSVRFDDGAANGLSRFGNNSRNALTFTISFWIKRTELGAVQQLVNCKAGNSGSNAFLMTINADDEIQIGGQPNAGTTGAGSHRAVIETNNKLRDPSAWYHIVYRQDTTQSTAANRHILYINNEVSSNSTYAALDEDAYFLYFYDTSSFPYSICVDERDNVYGDYYMAEHHYCDGVSNAASEFGETDEDSGIWKPKEYTGSHGTYGFFLEFKESSAGSGTSTVGGHDYTTGSASTIGADTSGNDNHFHSQGYATTDQCTDTPTNNFAIINSIWAGLSARVAPTLSEGNTQVDHATTDSGAWSTIIPANGKWYAEFKATEVSSNTSGIAVQNLTDGENNWRADTFQNAKGYQFFMNGKTGTNTGSTTSYGSAWSADEIIGIAMDLDNGKLYFAINNSWQDSGDPTSGATGTGAAFSIDAGDLHAIGSAYKHSLEGQWNFGNPAFSGTDQSDANGYGSFEYAPPSGYYALCTKNLAEYG